LNKMKIFYQQEENTAKYEAVHLRLEELDIEIRDNLYKMAVHIIRGSDLHLLLETARQEAESEGDRSKSANISQLSARSQEGAALLVSEHDAQELLEQWKRAVVREGEGGQSLLGKQAESQEELEERLREELFVESGVTVEDILLAFK